MYLELFEYFVNNHDILPTITLPLRLELLSSVYDTSNRILENKTFLKSQNVGRSKKMGGITVESLTNSLKLSSLFVNHSELIFKILKLKDYQPFYCSLLELQTVLKDMMNIFTSVIAKKVNEELAEEERKARLNIKIKSEFEDKNEQDTEIENEQKEDDDDNSHEEKDKHDDSDSLDNKNDMECISWVFNEDITCPHGKLIVHTFNILKTIVCFLFCTILSIVSCQIWLKFSVIVFTCYIAIFV